MPFVWLALAALTLVGGGAVIKSCSTPNTPPPPKSPTDPTTWGPIEWVFVLGVGYVAYRKFVR